MLDAETPTLASKSLPVEYQIPEIGHFLRISTLLKVFDKLPVIEMISRQETTISDFATFLSVTASTDTEFANLLANREIQARKLSRDKSYRDFHSPGTIPGRISRSWGT